MTQDPQDFESSLLPSEDFIMSLFPGDCVVIGGLKMEMGVVDDTPGMLGMVYLSAETEEDDEQDWYGYVHVRGNSGPGTRGTCWDKQHLAKSIAASEFWIG